MELLMRYIEYIPITLAPLIFWFVYKSKTTSKKDKYNVTKYVVKLQRHKENLRAKSKSAL